LHVPPSRFWTLSLCRGSGPTPLPGNTHARWVPGYRGVGRRRAPSFSLLSLAGEPAVFFPPFLDSDPRSLRRQPPLQTTSAKTAVWSCFLTSHLLPRCSPSLMISSLVGPPPLLCLGTLPRVRMLVLLRRDCPLRCTAAPGLGACLRRRKIPARLPSFGLIGV